MKGADDWLDVPLDDIPPHVTEGPPDDAAEDQVKPKAAPTAEFDAAMLDLAALDGRTPPARRFAWHPWVPAGEVTLLHGFGGVGKTLMAQQLATATAIGSSMFGGETEAGPVLMLAGEDSHDELWRRQVDINQRLGCTMADLAGKLYLIAAPHIDITIAEAAESGAVQPAATFDAIRAIVERTKPALIVLDNSAKLFAVKEGDRIAVTRCVRLLHSLCHDFNASVVLLAHNNKMGEFSGSTAWENACRSRLSLARDDDGETLTLKMPKANYSALGEIKLRWDRGSFRCEEDAGMSMAERIEAEQERRKHAETFLAVLDVLTGQRQTVSHKRTSRTYAPRMMVGMKETGGLTAKQLEAAMQLLIEERRIIGDEQVYQRANRTWAIGLARATEACT